MSEFFGSILIFIYVAAGYHANQWIRYNLMGVQAEYTSSLMDMYFNRILWAALLGWISIPIMIVAKMLKK